MVATAVTGRKSRESARRRIAGVASTAIHEYLAVPGTATVLGKSSHAVWLQVSDSVIVVSTVDATRLPNAVEIAAPAAANLLTPLAPGATVDIGLGRIHLGNLTIIVGRWWDPRPNLAEVTLTLLETALSDLPSETNAIGGEELSKALRGRSRASFLAASKNLIGRGTGLTPEGDDYLAGTIAAFRLLGEAANVDSALAMLDSVGPALDQLAALRTSSFSAALLHHAQLGRVAAPAAVFLRALAGRGDVAESHRRLSDVGHTSGAALAAGIVLGAQALGDGDTNDLAY